MRSRSGKWLATGVAAVACWLAPEAPADTVEIVRDSHGEPHVRGETAAAAMYGFAYAQMEDQADYVLRNIFRATGRSAEVIGPDCLPLLARCFLDDQMTHLMRVPEVAGARFDSLPRHHRARLEAFAAGINAFVRAHPEAVPQWAVGQRITGPDVVAATQWVFLMKQVKDASGLLAGFDPGPPAQSGSLRGVGGEGDGGRFLAAVDDLDFDADDASNMFAVDGSMTASGRPMLNGGPHMPFDGESRWYQARISYPGTNVAGATFRGIPGIGIGTNGDVAWSHTANHDTAHEQDAYGERLDPEDPNRYMYGGESLPMRIRTVRLKVRRGPGELVTIPVRFRYTIHGPVLTDPPADLSGAQPSPGREAAGTVTASQYEEVGLASELWRQNEAESIAEFKQATSTLALSQYNTIAADAGGSIFFVGASRSGVLNPGVPVGQLLDGSDPDNTWVSADPERPWRGVIPFDQLPQAENPASGYYQNANNTPWTTAPGQISIDDVPDYMQRGIDGTRSRRQRSLLTGASGLTLADVDEIGLDDRIEFAPVLIDLLDQAAARPGTDPEVQAAASVLDGWDYEADIDSTRFVLFSTWVRALSLIRPDFDPSQASAPYPDGLIGQPGGPKPWQLNAASDAMGAAHDAMIDSFGSLTVRAGDVHTIDVGGFSAPVGGGTQDAPALFMTSCKDQYRNDAVLVAFPCSATNGSGYVINVDLGGPTMHVLKALPGSDDPSSPFYTRNAQRYAVGQYRSFPLTDAAVEAEKTSEKRLSYRPPGARLRVERIVRRVGGRGRVTVRVRCRTTAMKRCSGRLVLEARRGALRHRRGERARTRVAIARRSYGVAPGADRLRLRLDRRSRRALRHGRVPATLRWTTRQEQGAAREGRRRIVLRRAR